MKWSKPGYCTKCFILDDVNVIKELLQVHENRKAVNLCLILVVLI
jgi:hypothetical protein